MPDYQPQNPQPKKRYKRQTPVLHVPTRDEWRKLGLISAAVGGSVTAITTLIFGYKAVSAYLMYAKDIVIQHGLLMTAIYGALTVAGLAIAHHTGKYYNRTDYYDLDDFEDLNPKDFPPVKDKPVSNKWYVLVSAQWGGTKRHPKIVGTDVKVANKLTSRQENAKKYSDYGGYIEIFTTESQARDFARTAELRKN